MKKENTFFNKPQRFCRNGSSYMPFRLSFICVRNELFTNNSNIHNFLLLSSLSFQAAEQDSIEIFERINVKIATNISKKSINLSSTKNFIILILFWINKKINSVASRQQQRRENKIKTIEINL